MPIMLIMLIVAILIASLILITFPRGGQVRIGGIATYMFLAEWRLALVAIGLVPLCAVIGKVGTRTKRAWACLLACLLACCTL